MLCKFDNKHLDEDLLLWYDGKKEVRFLKNLPFFTTEWGIASLVLEEIPYKRCAYITVQSALDMEKLLKTCAEFCRAVGAEHIYATGHAALKDYPLYTEIWEMTCPRRNMPVTTGELVPVTENTLTQWCCLYNKRMQDVPNAATMTQAAGEKLLKSKTAWFVYNHGELIGIGKAAKDRVDALVSLIPGRGIQVLGTLCGALTEETVCVEVASANERAVRLYSRLGFVKSKVIGNWHQIF